MGWFWETVYLQSLLLRLVFFFFFVLLYCLCLNCDLSSHTCS